MKTIKLINGMPGEDGWPCHHFVQLDGNFMLEAGNRHFLIVSALVNKTICVTTSDFAL